MEEKELKICAYCGDEFATSEGFEVDGKFCCVDCSVDYCTQCEFCYQNHCKDNMTPIEGEDIYICNDCIIDNTDIQKCETCGKYFYKKDLLEVNGDYYCEECSYDVEYDTCSHCNENDYIIDGATSEDTNEFFCSYCREHHLTECNSCHNYFYYNLSTDVDNEPVCSECISEYYRECESCGEIIHYEYAIYDEEEEYYYCQSCYDDISTSNLHNWNYKPNWDFIKTDNENSDKNMFIGVELEINKDYYDKRERKKCVDNICENNEYVYCKLDGSISNGFEIVSQPCTYNAHNQMVDWKKIFDTMDSFEFNSTYNAGLHFHINREYFNTFEDIQKLDYFINNKANEIFITDKGGRAFNGYCQRVDKRENSWGYQGNNDRYLAVNLQNDNTVELRFCASTTEYDEFKERLFFIYQVVTFIKNVTFEELKTKDNIELFKRFIANN